MIKTTQMNKKYRIAKVAIVSLLATTLVLPSFGTTLTTNTIAPLSVANPVSATAPLAAAKKQLILVTNTVGINDHGFNSLAFKGLNSFSKESGALVKILESRKVKDYMPNLIAAAKTKNCLIYGVGSSFKEPMATIATKYPNQHFVILDAVVEKTNVASIVFNEEEGSYLMGVAAGLVTKSNQIGFIAGENTPLVKKHEIGFRAGVASVNSKANVVIETITITRVNNSGEKISEGMYKKGIDVIYTAGGNVAPSVAKAATKYDFWFIGSEVGQSDLAPKNTLCTMVKKMDSAVADMAEMELNGTFKGGIYRLGIAENGVGYYNNLGMMSTGTMSVLEIFKKAIANDEVDVPSTEKELSKFKIPSIKFQRPTRATNK